jgi:hypothetical protein
LTTDGMCCPCVWAHLPLRRATPAPAPRHTGEPVDGSGYLKDSLGAAGIAAAATNERGRSHARR